MPTLGRSTPGSKLLARMHYDNALFPFDADDWAGTGGTISVVDGRLRFTDAGFQQIRYTPVADRSETFLYAAQKDTGASSWLIATVHHSGAGDGYNDSVASWLETRQGASTRTNLYTITDGVGSLHATDTVTDRAGGVWRHGLYVNGTAITQVDYDKNVTNTATSTRSSGGVGTEISGGTTETEHYVACPSRAVTVTGVPTGGSIEIRKADDTVLSLDDTLDDGVGIINMQSEFIRLEECVKLVVKNSSGTIIGTYDAGALDEIIEPGETYTLTGNSGDGAESWAHPVGDKLPLADLLTTADPIDWIESGHRQ